MHEEQFSLEIYADKDYEGFVKDFMRIELEPLNQLQLSYLYEIYMDNDDLPLINPVFQDMAMEMDWTPIYFQNHLEHLLSYPAQERDIFVEHIRAYNNTGQVIDSSLSFGLSHQAKQIIDPNIQYFDHINTAYVYLMTEVELKDQPSTFASLVDAALREGLVEDKERFLRNYLDRQELEK